MLNVKLDSRRRFSLDTILFHQLVSFDWDIFFLLDHQRFCSSGALYSVETSEVLMYSQSFLSSSMDDSLKLDMKSGKPLKVAKVWNKAPAETQITAE